MAIIEDELNLTDLIEVDILQKIQDSFSLMTGIASLTTDRNGVAVTKGSNFSDFCTKYSRSTDIGRQRCENCDRTGAETARKDGVSCAYFCHAGLVDFAAPIMAGGRMVGCFIGGQVITEPPDEEKIRKVAEEIGVSPDELVEASRKIQIVDKQTIDKATTALYTIANVLSEIAFGKYQIYLKNLELEKSSHLKSDFLANMSHEIRTPMNAVIGMAEMTLREEISPAAREYVSQIKSSGQTLLTIINDILDFSKIEAGQMDIHEVEYKPMSLINDIINIIVTRIGNKNLELTVDVNPDLPCELYGDNIRLKQIIINLANNAVKFTKEGCVHLKIDFLSTDEDNIELQVDISDTGSGIKKKDMSKLFRSFQQVDSKRNRNIEGTGLGLAICKQLVSLMHGKIHVDSEYGKGSTFSFIIPQKVVDRTPSIKRVSEHPGIASLIQNPYVAKQLQKDMDRLDLEYTRISTEEDLCLFNESNIQYLFVEHFLVSQTVRKFLQNNPSITGVILINFRATRPDDLSNVRIVKKPLYGLNLASIFHRESSFEDFTPLEADTIDFIAPDAEILIVDDNAINLTVALGLLEPLNMKIDTASGGKEAVEKVSAKKYDVVFMDHMMPEVDGVEATRVIRRMLGENGQIPIIALTANAVDGTREMFISEGMNDFVTKPIEVKVITAKLKKWLPPEKVIIQQSKTENTQASSRQQESASKQTNISIPGLDTQKSLELLGSEKLFWAVLKEYYRVIDKKYALIKNYEQNNQWKEFTIEVHALKSASRQIGAYELATTAEQLEAAGNARDIPFIRAITPRMLEQYLFCRDLLAPYFMEESKEEGTRQTITKEALKNFFNQMKEALENLDMDAMEQILHDMNQYKYDEAYKDYLSNLHNAVEDIDTELCEEILNEWESIL